MRKKLFPKWSLSSINYLNYLAFFGNMMNKRKVFITSDVFSTELQRLSPTHFEVKVHHDSQSKLTEEELINIGNNYDYVIANLTNKFTKRVLDASERLKLISNIAVGYDNIDISAATQNKIYVTTTPETLHQSVAEFTVGLLLMATKNVSFHQKKHSSGQYPRWSPTFGLGVELFQKEIGIIGLGQIGQEIGRILHFGFGCKINYLKNKNKYDPDFPVTAYSKDEFFKTQKIIIISCPLTKETRGLIGKKEIAQMPLDTTLINIARGEIIDQEELIKNHHKFIAIGLDVTNPDPLPNNHQLLKMEKIFITPHIASATKEARLKMVATAIDNIITHEQGGEKVLKNYVNNF